MTPVTCYNECWHEEELSPHHSLVLETHHDQFSIHRYEGWYNEASLCNEVLQGKERQLGPDHDDTLWTLHELARVYRNQRRPANLGLLSDMLKREQQISFEQVRGFVYLLQERYSEAEAMLVNAGISRFNTPSVYPANPGVTCSSIQ
jgi:hypothetical protein